MTIQISVDASSPALVTGAALSSTITTAAFNPPADTLLVACVVANSSSTGITTAAFTNKGAAITWTPQSVADFNNGGMQGYAAIYTAPLSAARTGMTVTATTAGSTATTRRPTLKVYVLNGAEERDVVSFSGVYKSTVNAENFFYTNVTPKGLLIVAASEWQKRGVPTCPNLTGAGFDQAGADGVSGYTGYRDTGTTLVSQDFSLDAFGTSTAAWNVAVLEVKPALPMPTGAAIIPHALANAKVAVEVAWGVDLTQHVSLWNWTEITEDVRIKDRINIKVGRGDEASSAQPAHCTMTLDNRDSLYSIDGSSPNWPNVTRGVPVRVMLDVGDGQGMQVVFAGYADGFSPGWNLKGNDATVELSASGYLRRLSKNTAPVISPITRAISTTTGVIAYWPVEEGKNADIIAPRIGSANMRVDYGTTLPNFASFSEYVATYPIPKLNGSKWRGNVDLKAATGYLALRFLVGFPSTDATHGNQIISFRTNGTIDLWQLRYQNTGDINIQAWAGATLVYDLVWNFNIIGQFGQLALTLKQNGANVDYVIFWLSSNQTAGQGSGTVAGRTVGSAVRVDVNDDGGNNEIALGQIAVYNQETSNFTLYDEINAYSGDLAMAAAATNRLKRIADENNIAMTIASTSDSAFYAGNTMGPQPLGTVLDIMRDAEQVNGGLLYDGVSFGLNAVTALRFQNQTDFIEIDAAAGELAQDFQPVHDDSGFTNKVTITRQDGASYTVEEDDGSLGTNNIGIYESSQTLNFETDTPVLDRASWEVMQGTIEGYRFPSVTIDILATPELAPGLSGRRPGDRIDLLNLKSVLAGSPPEQVRLTVEGYSWEIGSHTLKWTANCSSFERWAVGVLAAETGDTNEYSIVLDTDASTLNASYAQGVTSISVATPSGPLWTRDTDDYPLYLDVGGIKVTATACSGTTSPQTFTISALQVARVSGTPVKVWAPPSLNL